MVPQKAEKERNLKEPDNSGVRKEGCEEATDRTKIRK